MHTQSFDSLTAHLLCNIPSEYLAFFILYLHVFIYNSKLYIYSVCRGLGDSNDWVSLVDDLKRKDPLNI